MTRVSGFLQVVTLPEMRIAKGTVVRAKLGDGMDAFKLLYHSFGESLYVKGKKTDSLVT